MGSAGSDTSPQAKRRKMDLPIPQLSTSDDLVICAACGAQYEVTEDVGMESCRICEVFKSRACVCSIIQADCNFWQ